MVCKCLIEPYTVIGSKILQTMSRSRKKTPAGTIACCKSQKKDKQMCNRLFRSKSKQYIRVGKEPPCRLREVMNVWNFAGDGKVYWGYDWQGVEKLMRK